MFATLLGALPRPPGQTDHIDGLVELAVRAQEDAGLEPITDGRLRGGFEALLRPDVAVQAWRSTQALTDRAVKQALPGPISSGADVDALAAVIAALLEAGCPLIEIEESNLGSVGEPEGRARFQEAHERLVGRATGVHLTLSLVGGAPPQDAWATVLGLAYQSLALDLITGPDSWNLATRWPGDRGVIVGAESGREADEPKEVLLWAAHYAASTKGRGLDRVGLGSAGSWANLTWEAAVRKMRLLGETARLASLPPSKELSRQLNPQSISARRAALGHDR